MQNGPEFDALEPRASEVTKVFETLNQPTGISNSAIELKLVMKSRQAIGAMDVASKALDEVRVVVEACSEQLLDALTVIRAARRIVSYGVGREGLVMKALIMRLYHLGMDAHMVGDMTTPPLAEGDLLIVSAGPGHFATVQGLMTVAKRDGAKILCFTACSNGLCAQLADHVFEVPAQAMADGPAIAVSVLPMGSLYEMSLFLIFEVLVIQLREKLNVQTDEMRSRHTNLE